MNQGLFAKSYGFIREYQDERFTQLKESLAKAKKIKDFDRVAELQALLTEEKQFSIRQKNDRQTKQQKDELKRLNKERVAQGKEPIYAKRNEVKNMHLRDQFEKLEKTGKLDSFLEKRHQMVDKKRARVN